MNNEQNQPSIDFKDILQNIGAQLKSRQKLIMKRVAFTSLPLIIPFALLAGISEISDEWNLSDQTMGIIAAVLIGFIVLFALPWAIITGKIFSIERVIWIDSFFDKIALTDKQSWKMAKGLFWPTVWLNILVFFKYVLPVLLLCGAIIAGYLFLVFDKTIEYNVGIFLGGLVAVVVGASFYFYYLNIRLRYLPFLLADTYGNQNFSYGGLFTEMKRLNKATKTKDFVKMLVVTLGTDAVETAVTGLMNAGTNAVASQLGGTGKAVAQAAGMYANQVVATNKSYAQTVTFYVYYRVARKLTFGESQSINQALYQRAGQAPVAKQGNTPMLFS